MHVSIPCRQHFLKVAVSRSSYVHIGYSLRDFHMPNFLMLGVGYRFNNKYPRLR